MDNNDILGERVMATVQTNNQELVGKKIRMIAKPSGSANVMFNNTTGICFDASIHEIDLRIINIPDRPNSDIVNLAFNTSAWDYQIVNEDWDE
jgi:hypothetical protein